VLDLGRQADTIEIVRRFIAMHSGLRLELTHLIGSDVAPIAARFIAQDMAVWRKEAAESHVDYQHTTHIVQRSDESITAECQQAFAQEDVRVVVDPTVIRTPSSTDFRTRQAYTIVLPTRAIQDKMEIIFRYHMHRTWSSDKESD